MDVWVTNSNGGDRLSKKASLSPTGSSNGFHINVDRNKRYQFISGFGAALTNAAAYTLFHSPRRDQIMEDLFGSSGITMSYLRLPMGGTDFQGVQPYTYDDLPSWQHNDFHMDQFSIQKDRDFIIPILKQALKINPSLRIIATPWSAPAWMKTTNSLFGGEFHHGNNYQQAYALYFVKFIQAYQSEGISIDAICLQNEPKHSDNSYPTMKLSWEAERDIIKNYLGPAFNQHSINTKIIIYDHNWDDTGYAGNILSDGGAAQYIRGSAWHCYGGRHDTCGGFHNQHPDKDIYFTECSGGDWAPGFNVVWGVRILSIGQTRNWAKTVMYWNIALDDNHGPKVGVGGCNNCNGVITVHGNGDTTKNTEYYIIGHMSKFVFPEAVRLDTPAFGWDDVHSVAFQNNDGSVAIVVLNPRNDRDQTFYIDIDGQHYQYTLPRESVATFVYRN